MKLRMFIVGGVLLAFVVGNFLFFRVSAANGLPNNGLPDSPAFGYGAWVDPQGLDIDLALQTAVSLELDWIAVAFDWAQLAPEANAFPNLSQHDYILNTAAQKGLPVLLSVEHAPAWAMTGSGPDPALTANMLLDLTSRYPGILAIELFPAANTLEGWGAAPNPEAYVQLFQHMFLTLQANSRALTLIAAGLTPQPANSTNMDDLQFLDRMYLAGIAPMMPVVGVHLPRAAGQVMAAPAAEQPQVLRHYEAVRNIMLKHNHVEGLLWLSRFAWPAEQLDAGDPAAAQANWMQDAYQLMNAQLYVGAAIFYQLNPPANADANTVSLLLPDQSRHLALERLGQLIALQNSEQAAVMQYVPAQTVPRKRIQSDKGFLKP